MSSESSTQSDSPRPTHPTDSQLADLIAEYNVVFDKMCQERHIEGSKKYGPVKFLDEDTDMVQMLMEELVDAANYSRYFFIRLALINDMIVAKGKANQKQQDSPLGRGAVSNPHARG